MRTPRIGFACVLAALVAACGGGGDDNRTATDSTAGAAQAPVPIAAPTVPSSTEFSFPDAPDDAISAYIAAVAAGGDARATAPRPLPACSGVTAVTADSFRTIVVSLDDLVERTRGTPCIFDATSIVNASGQRLTSGPRNEWWTNATQLLAVEGTAPTAAPTTAPPTVTAFYTTNALRSVAFPAGGTSVTYLDCQQRYDGSTRNCTVAGSGSYRIRTLSDGGRVMTLTDLPPAWRLPAAPVFIERGGRVFRGSAR